MRIAWCSDIHLDMADGFIVRRFVARLIQSRPDAVLITGDIATGTTIADEIVEFSDAVGVPVYFVLGNHDYYGRPIEAVRDELRQLTNTELLVNWLPATGTVHLGGGTVLMGHGCWADGRSGTGIVNSAIRMNDEQQIEDLADSVDRTALATKVAGLAEEGNAYLLGELNRLGPEVRNVVIATHAPPFEQACMYEGQPSEPDALPHFCNRSLGNMLGQHANQTERHLTLLAGHTHDQAMLRPAPNLQVHVAAATYGTPAIAAILEIGEDGSLDLQVE